MDAIKVPAVFMRGGTSKAVFFHEKDISSEGAARDRFLKRIMGTPNPTQVDGMGGTRVTTSKMAITRCSERPDADIDYIFVQVGTSEDTIGYDGNCGNISAAVGPFALDEKLVKPERPEPSISGPYTTEIGSSTPALETVRFMGRKGLRLPVNKEFGFSAEEVVKAFEYLQSGAHISKVCIKVRE